MKPEEVPAAIKTMLAFSRKETIEWRPKQQNNPQPHKWQPVLDKEDCAFNFQYQEYRIKKD